MTKQPVYDGEIEKALTDYQEGMRLDDGVRAAGGMRLLQSLEGSDLELMAKMLGQDPNLDKLFLYYLKFVLKRDGSKDYSLTGNASALMVALAAGDGIAVTKVLSDVEMLKGDDLELLAKMLENSDHSFPYSLGFVQRRTGPPVDPLATKARWFKIHETYKKIPETIEAKDAAPKKKQRRAIIREVMVATGSSRSLIQEVLKYFKQFRK
jgi:hypothetical protein